MIKFQVNQVTDNIFFVNGFQLYLRVLGHLARALAQFRDVKAEPVQTDSLNADRQIFSKLLIR